MSLEGTFQTSTPHGMAEGHDPFPLDDDSKLKQVFFQIRRAIRYMDTETINTRMEFERLSRADEVCIRRLRKEIESFDLVKPKVEGKGTFNQKKQRDKIQLKEMYEAKKDSEKEEAALREELASLQKEKTVIRNSIFSLRRKLGPKLKTNEKLFYTQRKVHIARSNIATFSNKLGQLLAENRKLRATLDDMRLHYKKYETLQDSLEEQLTFIKDEIQNQVISANENLTQRKLITKRMDVLLMQAEKEKKANIAEIRELKVTYLHYNKLTTFMKAKLDTRHTQLLNEMKNQVIDENVYMSHENKLILAYEKAITMIKHITGESDIKVICDTFEDRERQILYTTIYANNLRRALEMGRDEIGSLLGRNQSLKRNDEAEEEERGNILKFYENKFKKIAVTVDDMESKTSAYKKVIAGIQSDVQELITVLSIEQANFDDALIKPKFDYKGAVDYLSLLADACVAAIFQTENKKVATDAYFQAANIKMMQKDAHALSSTKLSGPTPFILKMKGPPMQQMAIDEGPDDNVRILTQKEIYTKAKNVVAAREQLGRQPSEESVLKVINRPKSKTKRIRRHSVE